jgi:hypothetical protein
MSKFYQNLWVLENLEYALVLALKFAANCPYIASSSQRRSAMQQSAQFAIPLPATNAVELTGPEPHMAEQWWADSCTAGYGGG